MDRRRWQNVSGTPDYIERIEQGRLVAIQTHEIGERARIEEALFTGLRLVAGIRVPDFVSKYGLDPWAEYGERLSDAFAAGLVWRRADSFGLTRPGMLLANEVLSVFV
jgi:coproporphyrinogen III oxidase-like Fe-S oxidoreductase